MRSRPAGPRSRYSRPGWATCSTNFFQPATEPFALEIAMTMPVRAALYLRVSTGRQAENDLSIPDQRRQAKGYCASRGVASGRVSTIRQEYILYQLDIMFGRKSALASTR